jgi:hypothetical protein
MSLPTSRDLQKATILTDHYSFSAWYQAFEARCISLNVWDLINPDSTTTPVEKPALPRLPQISAYEPAIESTLSERARRGTPSANQLRAALHAPVRKQDLSAAGLQSYNEDVELYKLMLEEYKIHERSFEKEQRNLDTVTSLIQSTVSPHLQKTCCLPQTSLRKWVTNLKQRMGTSLDEERAMARERYHNALRPMRAVSSWDTWLLEYDHAATNAEAEGVPEATDPNAVMRDFLKAVRKVVPNWADNFKENQLNLPGMNRKEMMKRYRERMSEDHPRSKPYKGTAFAVGDHFDSALAVGGASTPGTERDASDSVGQSAPSTLVHKTRGKRPAGRQRGLLPSQRAKSKRPGGSVETDGASCPACEQPHQLVDCYYVFRDKAPEWWTPRPGTERLVSVLLEHDVNFQEQVRACKRSRTRTPATKLSHTPEVSLE